MEITVAVEYIRYFDGRKFQMFLELADWLTARSLNSASGWCNKIFEFLKQFIKLLKKTGHNFFKLNHYIAFKNNCL